MVFIVEDGTIVAGATSLVDEVFADAYFADVGNTIWSGLTSTVKQQSLIKATRFFEKRYKIYGKTKSATQPLSFPRTGLFDSHENELVDLVPDRIKNGICELALIANTEDLFFTPEFPSTSGAQVIEKKEKLGPLEEVTKWRSRDPGVNINIERQLPNAEYWFRGFIVSPHSETKGVGRVYR